MLDKLKTFSKTSSKRKQQMDIQTMANKRELNIFQELLQKKSILLELFDVNGEVVNYCAVAPSPSRDYCQIIIKFNEIIYRHWKITRRNDSNRFPIEIKCTSFSDFKHDDNLKHHVMCAFGKNFFEYVRNMIQYGQVDYLQRLKEPLILNILSYLSLEDLSRLSQVNTYFRQLCRSDLVWMDMYKRVYTNDLRPELIALASKKGWRTIFFTNKIKLQVQLRREHVDEEPAQMPQMMITRDDSFLKVVPPIIRRHSSKAQLGNNDESLNSKKPLMSARLPNNKSGARF